jgi:arylsulfatase A-like enzyme
MIILLDDVGFGMASTFGGPVPTPNFDRLAANGLKYNQFHTTALCSPTRGALLAGRNHHSIGTGVIIEMGTGYPGYTGIIPKSTALVSQTLRDNGFATSMFGKWHNTPEPDISPAGPFDRWPTGLGFDYFYGFNQGETHQYYPTLYRNTVAVKAPKTPEQGYHFTSDMTDETITWINNVNATDTEKPWFVYYSTGAVHAPHHAPKEWRDKYKLDSESEEMLLERFRDPSDQLQILIVTAKLLTGFDAPILQTQYLDKPLRDHTLLQAICRTNRPFPQKTHGLIVDYLGIFDDVAQALLFDDASIQKVITNISELKIQFPDSVRKC